MKKYWMLLIGVVIMFQGCDNKKDLAEMSPQKIVDLYIKAKNDGDANILRQIVYLPPNASDNEINNRLGILQNQAHKAGDKEAKTLMNILDAKVVSKYEKILDENTAEVGICIKAMVHSSPFDQLVLKKENNTWKVDYARSELTKEHLIEVLREKPDTAWAWYWLGMHTQSDSFYKAHRYYKKYYELEPNGFFVSDDFLENLENWGNFEKQENELLKLAQNNPPDSDGMISDYIRLCQLCMVYEKYVKADKYLEEAHQIIKRKNKLNSHLKDEYEKTKRELKLRKDGEYVDILDEIEAKQNK